MISISYYRLFKCLRFFYRTDFSNVWHFATDYKKYALGLCLWNLNVLWNMYFVTDYMNEFVFWRGHCNEISFWRNILSSKRKYVIIINLYCTIIASPENSIAFGWTMTFKIFHLVENNKNIDFPMSSLRCTLICLTVKNISFEISGNHKYSKKLSLRVMSYGMSL